ncbi:MAG: hypothetical protein R3Y59_06905 [bacterium]
MKDYKRLNEFLKFVDKKFTFIAKDKDGKVFYYKSKPTKGKNTWIGGYDWAWVDGYDWVNIINIDKDVFDCLSWEDEEPYKIVRDVDWSTVAVDTPILVREGEDFTWIKRHFAKYENDRVFAWVDGKTSWTDAVMPCVWKFAELAQGDKENESNN